MINFNYRIITSAIGKNKDSQKQVGWIKFKFIWIYFLSVKYNIVILSVTDRF